MKGFLAILGVSVMSYKICELQEDYSQLIGEIPCECFGYDDVYGLYVLGEH